ncbi:AAA family ATPase [Clostridium sp.]|uniref:AAA family ATPase n=1 Tax=Clostridium sp. TaxID=1506 RepID=UPI003216F929
MIAGMFVRHYKIYQGVYFIPICNDYNKKYSVFIGNNGVGKSSVFEALNTFFNNGYWNKNKQGKKDEAFIAPLFLIEKKKFNERFAQKPEALKFIQVLSDYFWNERPESNPNFLLDEFKKFFDYRNILKEQYKEDEFYLFIVGIEYENKSKVDFISFNRLIKDKIPSELNSFDYDCLIDIVKEYYSYIYIPVQASPSDILKIESKEIQELMNTDILDEIDSILNEKNFDVGRRKISVIDFLNDSLNHYMDSINEIIQKIDGEYAYKVEGAYKKNLTSNDVRKKILEAYFSIRTLKKERKEVEELSSGEQRIAVIDIATAFLLQSKSTYKNIIFAIDEPENSLHISKAFNQFERLDKLSNKHQCMITTHWYGSLPITSKGNLQYLAKDRKINISSFNFNNYFESRREFPEDIMIKSYFELTSSILSSMRVDKTNWIICEGIDDKLYLQHYLTEINNLKIFSVGGCANVAKLYKYFYIPFSEKDESKALEGKMLCLVDTDDEVSNLNLPFESEIKNKKLKLVRMQHDRSNKIELKKFGTNGFHNPTEMEDCLNPEILFNALMQTISSMGTEEQKEAIKEFVFNQRCEISRIKGENSILGPKTLEALAKKEIIYSVFDDYRFKYVIAENYIDIAIKQEEAEKPELFKEIQSYFEA